MKTNIKTLIKSAMANRSYTQEAVAKKAGWKNQSSLATAIGRDNPSLDTIMRVLNAMEYDLVIRDRNSKTEWAVKMEDEK